jgi:hypothetical protein
VEEGVSAGAYTEWPMPSLGRTVRRVPAARLLVLGEVALLARRHLAKLDPEERRRIVELVRRGRGRRSNLTERERRELARLVQKAEPRGFANEAVRKFTGFSLPGSGRSRDEVN